MSIPDLVCLLRPFSESFIYESGDAIAFLLHPRCKRGRESYYNSNFEEMGNWPLMIEFLDAAYNFTQQKVLLKKI